MTDIILDTIIIGAGPAGISAAVYASRTGLNNLVLEDISSRSQISLTDRIENFPGLTEGIPGYLFIENLKKQASKFGAKFESSKVTGIRQTGDGKNKEFLVTGEEKTYKALSVIIATGASPGKLGVPGEETYFGRGISHCAVCDAPFFKNKTVVVVGGGDSAIQNSLFLTKFAEKILLIHRRDRLRAKKFLQDKIFAEKKVSFLWNSVVESISGDNTIKSVTIKNIATNEKKDIPCDGVFVFIGWKPNTGFAGELLNRDDAGYIITGPGMNTSVEGIYAGGDCRVTPLKQAITASSDGAVAAMSAHKYIDIIKGTVY
ncbi:MAG: Thioredoxin reductase [Elusimicrobia bacterium ADurb.Bin231]|nr:MAG: Thioredoxin reductase [Elusimicrobia bacterium ADurb.Bin231]